MTTSHFTSFTPEGMRTFRQTLSAQAEQRREFVAGLYSAERDRRQIAAKDADARRLFISELRSGVHALRSRFGLARRDMVADFQLMARELQAARQAFHEGHNGHGVQKQRPIYAPAGQRPNSAQPAHEGIKSAARPTYPPAAPVHAEKTHDKTHDDKNDYPKKRHS
jgi:hypothetical protein